MADEEDTYDLAPVAPAASAKRASTSSSLPPLPPALPVSPSAQATHPPRPVPLPYVRAGTMPGRPGILTAVAIVGIIVGLLSVLASGGTAWFWGYAWVHSQPPPPPPPGGELSPASVQAYAGETIGPRGLPRAARTKLLDAFPLKGAFAADRRAMLDRLLAEIGQDVAPGGSIQVVATAREREGNRIRTETPWAREMFVLPTGRVIVGNTSCTYRTETIPTDADSLAKLQRNEFEPGQQPTDVSIVGSIVFANNKHRLAAVAIDDALTDLQRGRQVTPLQLAYVARELQQTSPDPRASESFRIPFWPDAATVDKNGMLTLPIGPDIHYILADGRGVSSRAAPLGVDSETGRIIPNPPPPNTPMLQGDPSLMLALSVHSAASLALGVLLISGSIRLLMNSPGGPTWLAAWAYLKFLLIVVEIFIAASFIYSVGATPGGASIGYDAARGTFSMILSAVVQAAFPVVVLLTLFRMESVGEFLMSRGAAAQSPASWFAQSPAWAARVALLLLVILVVVHLLAAWGRLRGGGGFGFGSIVGIGMSVVVLIGAALAGLWFARRARGLAVSACLAIALLSTGAAPARPATQPSDAKAVARAKELTQQLQTLRPLDDQYFKLFEELARLGEPAMDQVFEQLFKFGQPTMIDVVVREWTAQKLIAKPGPRKKLRALAPKIVDHWHGGPGVKLLALLGKDPTLVPLLVPHCFTPIEEHRRTYIAAVVFHDPKATPLIAEALKRSAMVDQQGSWAMSVLDDLGPLGRGAKLKLTHSANGEVRSAALRHLMPADDVYAKDVVDRALQLLHDPVQGVKPDPNDRYQRRPEEVAQSVQGTAIAALAASGIEGRRKLVAMLNGPQAVPVETRGRIVSTLHGQIKEFEKFNYSLDVARPEQWPVVLRVVRLYVERTDAAADEVLRLLDSSDRFERDLGVRVVVSAADTGVLKPAQFDRALVGMRGGGNPELRDMLFKTVSQSPKLSSLPGARKLAAEVVKAGPYEPSYRPALQMLATGGKEGREVLYAALSGNTIQQPKEVIDALIGAGSMISYTFAVSELSVSGRRGAVAEDWQRPGYRDAVIQLIRLTDDPRPTSQRPDEHEAFFNDFKRKLVTMLMGWLTKGNADEQLVAARSLRLSDEYAQNVGLDTRRRLDALIGPAQNLGGPPSDPSQAAAFREFSARTSASNLTSLAWLATALLLPLVLWLAISIRSAETASID